MDILHEPFLVMCGLAITAFSVVMLFVSIQDAVRRSSDN